MTYAVKQNIDDLYGVDLLNKLADKNNDRTADPAVVERGLRSADGIINGYLEGKYNLPINGTSDMLTEIAVDIAVYKIAILRSVRSTEMRQRYEDALALLDKISAGKIGLGIDPGTGTGGTGGTTPTTPGASMMGRSVNTYRR